jgi:hypothetical protein
MTEATINTTGKVRENRPIATAVTAPVCPGRERCWPVAASQIRTVLPSALASQVPSGAKATTDISGI